MRNILTFTNYYFFIIVFFLCSFSFSFGKEIGLSVTGFFSLWYYFERKGLKEKISELRTDFDEALKHINFITQHINLNIIHRLNYDTINEQTFKEIIEDNNKNFSLFFENLEAMYSIIKAISHIEDTSGTLSIHVPELSYMHKLYYQFYNLNIDDFQKNFECTIFSHIKEYRNNWIELYTRVH